MDATDGLEDQKDGYVNDNDRALLKVHYSSLDINELNSCTYLIIRHHN